MNDITDTLRGRPFIGESKEFYGRDDRLGTPTPRTCPACFYIVPGDRGCGLSKAKEYFGFAPDEVLPKIVDGKEVGRYCPFLLDCDVE
jgi:hypothetical protein